jgi:F0F1-type ATP synthase membrane subunit b/b'
MKPISEVIREKEMEITHVREEIDALLREKELHIKNIERELETLRAAAAIMGDTAGHAPQPQAMAAAAPIPTAPVESFPVQSATPAPEPARKRWP